MKKSEFIEELICHIETECMTKVGDCYDVTIVVHKLVNDMTKENDIEWDAEDEN